MGQFFQRDAGPAPVGGFWVLAAWLALSCVAQPLPSGEPAVLLDLRPATRTPATHAGVEDGDLSLLTWCPSSRRVVDAHRRSLTDAERSDLRDLLAAPGLRRSSAGSTEPGEPVDLYTLRLGHPPVLVASGAWADAPAPVRNLWAFFEAAVAGQSFPRVAADAYLRSEALTRGRLRSIRRRGLVSLLEPGDVPEASRPALRRSLSSPHRFIAVDAGVREDLLPLTSHGHDLFVLEGADAYQVGLFSAAAGTGCSPGSAGPRVRSKIPESNNSPHSAEASVREDS